MQRELPAIAGLLNCYKQPKQPDFHCKIYGFLAAIKLTDKYGYPDNGYPDMQTLLTATHCLGRCCQGGVVQSTSFLYRQLRHTKSADFWRSKLEANQSDPHKLWKLVDDLLGRGRVPASTAVDVEVFSRFFAEKVAKVRSSTADAPAPTFTRALPGVSFGQFQPLTTVD